MKTTVGQVGMVDKNRRKMAAQWRTKTTEGGRRWCIKTAVGQMGDGVQKPPLSGWAMVYDEMGGRWCMETTVGQVGMVDHEMGGQWCTKTNEG